MKFNIITWNINFIHDGFFKRLININKILEKEMETTHIIALQEATLPFGDKIKELYSFLTKPNLKYFDTPLLERNNLYKNINKISTKYKKYIFYCFDYLMNKLLLLCCYLFSYLGYYHKNLYFNYPYIFFIVSFLFIPIGLGMWYFFGLLVIYDKSIKTVIKNKNIDNRIIQYFDFVFNNKDVRVVNIHLPPGKKIKDKERRLKHIKKIIRLCKKKKNVIILGDFNDNEKSNIFRYMIKKGYNSVHETLGEYVNTYPCDNPEECIDFVMIKGNIKIEKASLFGDSNASDHKGIKVTLDI